MIVDVNKGFSKGMHVIVHKPIDTDETPIWIEEMDDYDNMLCMISNVTRGIATLIGKDGQEIDYSFSVNWLELYVPLDESMPEIVDDSVLDEFLSEWR